MCETLKTIKSCDLFENKWVIKLYHQQKALATGPIALCGILRGFPNPPTVNFFSKRKTVEANIKMAEDMLGHDLLD
ncbi:hypothetical protein [Shewanella sp. 1180_01]|uniref:hypothetical protein n=1 Tax=Shewanella sp. 1180_01 TaxID=2604451 RepID=UPI0040629C4A